MKPFALATTFALLAIAPIARAQSTSLFRFHAPPGWTELTPANIGSVPDVPQQVIDQLRTGQFAFMATDGRITGGAFRDNVNVVVVPGGGDLTESAVREVAEGIASQTSTALPGASAHVLSTRLDDFNGTPVGRIEMDESLGTFHVHALGFVFARGTHDDGEIAVMVFSIDWDHFDAVRPTLEIAARATHGLERPSMFRRLFRTPIARAAVIGGLGGGLGALLLAALRVRRKS